ncbi:TPA: DUF2570 domain-containing protein [Salmonella enterica subsp. enterica]|uniref:DUF2570 domain-containing protein n=2 Tax=Salmonella enterica TaxID=28901 RepID=A0A3U2S1D0_SALET|nr:DUF2570 domain-containing protein [Salmonella enterica subsp. enterica serovar Hessarek]ECG0999413.1 DUF2570 domain-containing protein [Salmonella enterica subsp. enterica]EHI3795548.1 DUF2570 domain-containing protein [Salmonella enterica]EBU7025019.1 DUF2570 domain-containing protein [Salmonella enterica subsp. enterica serovar Hessarek]EEN0968180.1 DUF2570 domain-containing protein [Salmonella enterica subsp. enterica serovar Hessarek]
MKFSYKLVIAAFFFTVIGSFIWSANHYYSKYQHEKKRADEAVQNAKSATVITNNVLQSLQIVNTVLEADGGVRLDSSVALKYIPVLAGIPRSSAAQLAKLDIFKACMLILNFFTRSETEEDSESGSTTPHTSGE